MMTRFVLTLLVGVLLAGCQANISSSNKKSSASSYSLGGNFANFSDTALCGWASGAGKWEIRDYFKPYVTEAKRRGLSCGVGETTQTASSSSSDFSDWLDGEVCENATFGGQRREWFHETNNHVKEARRRGLSCGVGKEPKFAGISNSDLCNQRWTGYTEEARRRGLSCGVGQAGLSTQTASVSSPLYPDMSDQDVCLYATVQFTGKSITPTWGSYKRKEHSGQTLNAMWAENPNKQKYVREAKRRGLSCNVNISAESVQTASVQVPKAEPNVTSAASTAAEKEAERLRQELAALRAEKAEQKQIISNDTKVPTITIASASTNGPQGTVKGRVSDNTGIAEVRVDGKQIQTDRDGNFTANTYVPEGGVSVSIQAVDLAGLSSSMSVRLDRSASNTVASISFERLNPLGRKVAKNKDALALIIGVDGYENTPARAIYADSDAKVFADYASQKVGIPTNRIKTLVNDGADEKGMLLAVKDWLSRASKKDKSDVYVFFAGHGLASQDGEKMYLLPYDGSPRLLEKTAILRDELFSDIASTNPRSVTVFLDTCYSGETRGNEMLIAGRPIGIRALKQSIPDNFTLMTAAAGDQIANPLKEAKHGMFSYFLMKGMEGVADNNKDNKITALELHEYVKENVWQQSSNKQLPELQGDADRVLVQFQ